MRYCSNCGHEEDLHMYPRSPIGCVHVEPDRVAYIVDEDGRTQLDGCDWCGCYYFEPLKLDIIAP